MPEGKESHGQYLVKTVNMHAMHFLFFVQEHSYMCICVSAYTS